MQSVGRCPRVTKTFAPEPEPVRLNATETLPISTAFAESSVHDVPFEADERFKNPLDQSACVLHDARLYDHAAEQGASYSVGHCILGFQVDGYLV